MKYFLSLLLFKVILISNTFSTVFTVDNVANTDDFSPAAPGTMTFVKCIRLASADATGGATGHRIYFNIAPAGQKILTVNSTWQQLNNTNLNNLIVDGSTQPFAGTGPRIIFVSGGISEGIQIAGLTNVTLKGLGFRNFQIGIKMDNAVSCTIANCFIGTNDAGTAPSCTGCTDDGIKMNTGCRLNTIGGTTPGSRNIIFGHNNGVYITGATSADNFIGATTVGEPNVISGNAWNGIYLNGAGTNNKIAGNIIGLNIAGNAQLTNAAKGILVQNNTQNTIIGGVTPGERNIISGNGFNIGSDGIFLENGCHNSQIINCYIGLDVTGMVAIKNNVRGILIKSSNNCQVLSNIIASHDEFGIYIQTSTGTIIRSSYIGLNAAGNGGAATFGNLIGINAENSSGTIIGGSGAGEGNYISGNDEHGIRLDQSSNSQISGNKIGITPSGASLGNLAYGIYLRNSDNNTIGGATAAFGNEIAWNSNSGIGISNAYWTGDGSPAASGSDNNFIYRNIIHHNNEDGIRLYKVGAAASIKNWISQNSIYCNVNKGINLSLTTGNNNDKARPVLTSVNTGTNTVFGTASAGDIIEVFYDSGCPTCQGKDYLGSATADGSGNWSFTNASITSSSNLTATATESAGVNRNTSEFATCLSVLPVDIISFSGRTLADGTIGLNWITSREVNNDYFILEKSYDGHNFTFLEKIKGNGNTAEIHYYSFTDIDFDREKIYYRLIQKDFDGSVSAPQTISVDFNPGNGFNIYPNPARSEFVLEGFCNEDAASVSIINIHGQIVGSRYINGKNISQHFDCAHLASGLYFIEIKTDSNIFKEKLVIE
ncbi:MAG: right-handed parallel beta-helix repeat-containing protein [Cytophagaceae bacterium]|nr:right-handed parallel beta-helix repeat-containing protein [Cytophagaceae bacterium]